MIGKSSLSNYRRILIRNSTKKATGGEHENREGLIEAKVKKLE